MIYAVCLNPCTDKTVVCDSFDPDRTNRVRPLRSDLGGKGVNCAKTLRALNVPVTLCGTEYRGAVRKGLGNDMPCLFEETGLPLRENLKIFDLSRKRTVEVNEAGDALPEGTLDRLLEQLLSVLEKGDTVILSGSLPAGESSDTYACWCRRIREKGATVAADCAGETLLRLLDAAPDLIKPNIGEFEELLTLMDRHMPGDMKGLSLILNAMRHTYRIRCILLSLGKDGALLSTDGGTWHCPPAAVEVKGDIGAGDAMAAAAAWQLGEGAPADQVLAYATAAAGAVLEQEGTGAPDGDRIRELCESCAASRI